MGARPLNDALSEAGFLINLAWFTCTVSGIHYGTKYKLVE